MITTPPICMTLMRAAGSPPPARAASYNKGRIRPIHLLRTGTAFRQVAARVMVPVIHFHMLFLDGVYIGGSNGHPIRFQRLKAPTRNELTKLTHTIAHRVACYLVHQGLLEHDTGNIYLTPEVMDASDEDPSNHLLGSSITYRVAVGPLQGRKVFA